jgi:hypothetical protein
MVLLVLLGVFVLQVAAQEATIVGTVTDPTGATVPSARISISNTETGQVRQFGSNEVGQYVAHNGVSLRPRSSISILHRLCLVLRAFVSFGGSWEMIRMSSPSQVYTTTGNRRPHPSWRYEPLFEAHATNVSTSRTCVNGRDMETVRYLMRDITANGCLHWYAMVGTSHAGFATL